MPQVVYIQVAIDAACFQPLTDWPFCCFFGSLLDAEFDGLWCVQLVIFMLCTALSSMLSVHRGLKHDGCPDLSGFFIKTGFVLDICFCYSQVCEVLYLTHCDEICEVLASKVQLILVWCCIVVSEHAVC